MCGREKDRVFERDDTNIVVGERERERERERV